MRLNEARAIAERVMGELAPFCERIEIAGSIRRKKPEVGDIEIVAIPRKVVVRDGLFDVSIEPDHGFVRVVDQWPAVKGKPIGKYTQRMLPDGIALDLFMATPRNWGLIFAIRTGSADYSHKVLAAGWVRAGYHSIDGILVKKDGSQVEVREERDLYRFLGIPWVEPEIRK